ncbi:MAG TPA: hypothetical protein VE961_27105 [Pyrinomonadaceae bacterium]|nr:hypothetical protein [Pyrinomonadaceae bacterium]
MKRKKKTTIVTFEARERTTIRCETPRVFAWCNQCGEEVWMVTASQAALMSLTDMRTIFRGVEAGAIHFIENDGNAILVCSKSLLSH